MLSNPALESSAGKQRGADRSRARADRESRWRTRRDSGGGRAGGRVAAAPPRRGRARLERRDERLPSARCGAGLPGGGIMPARSFLTTFSQTSLLRRRCGVGVSSARPPVLVRAVVAGDAVAIESRAVSGRAVFSFRVLTGRRNSGCGSRRTKHNNDHRGHSGRCLHRTV